MRSVVVAGLVVGAWCGWPDAAPDRADLWGRIGSVSAAAPGGAPLPASAAGSSSTGTTATAGPGAGATGSAGVPGLPSAADRAKTAAWVAGLQNEDGGFGATRGQPSTAPSTSAAIRSLKLWGGKVPDPAGALHFLRSCCHEGAVCPAPGAPATASTTATGMMGFVALKGADDPAVKLLVADGAGWLEKNAAGFEDVRIAVAAVAECGAKSAKAEAWIEVCRQELVDAAKNRGNAALARAAGGAAAALLRLGAAPEPLRWVVDTMEKAHAPDGGWARDDKAAGSDLETTYRVMRAYHMLGARPRRIDAVVALIAKCRKPDGSYSVTPEAAGDIRGTYYAGAVLGWVSAAK